MGSFGIASLKLLTFLITSGGIVGAGITAIVGKDSNVSSLPTKAVNNNQLIKKTISVKPELPKEKKQTPKPKIDNIVWEYVLFNKKGERVCEFGNKELLRYGVKRSNCSRPWAKKYIGETQKPRNMWLRMRGIDGNWVSQFRWKLWVDEIGENMSCNSLSDADDSKQGWKGWHCFPTENN